MPFKLNNVGNLNQATMKTSKIRTEKPIAGQSFEGSKFVLLWLKLLHGVNPLQQQTYNFEPT